MARPCEFDQGEALESIVDAFWAKGYRNTTIDDLTAATGLCRSSLYNAFGDKRELFQRALERYQAGPGCVVLAPFYAEHGAAAINAFFDNLAKFIDSSGASRGCLMVNSGIESAAIGGEIQSFVGAHFDNMSRLFARALEQARENGDFPAAIGDPQGAGNWLAVFVRGVLASAASGAKPEVLRQSIEITRRQWTG